MELFSRASVENEFRLGPDPRLLTGRNIIIGACLLSLAHLNNLEVLFLVLTRFRRRNGLYFWTVAIAAMSSTALAIGLTLLELVPGRPSLLARSVLGTVGYILYEPAEFLLVYSRLYLISASPRTKKCVLALIIAHTLLITIPTGVIVAGSILSTDANFYSVSLIMLRVKVCTYTAVELFLCSVFLYQVAQAWSRRTEPQILPVLRNILTANLLIICMHSAAISLSYLGYEALQLCLAVSYLYSTGPVRHTTNIDFKQTFLYAYQLKLEFWILNELTELSQSNLNRTLVALTLDSSDTTTATIVTVDTENGSENSMTNRKRRFFSQLGHQNSQQKHKRAVI
jgi:hypothetical protein